MEPVISIKDEKTDEESLTWLLDSFSCDKEKIVSETSGYMSDLERIDPIAFQSMGGWNALEDMVARRIETEYTVWRNARAVLLKDLEECGGSIEKAKVLRKERTTLERLRLEELNKKFELGLDLDGLCG